MRHAALAFATLVLVAPRAGAQDPRLGQRFAPDAARRLSAIIDSAATEKLPTDPLLQRALEGGAKGASLDQILLALDDLRGALRTARQTLGTDRSPVDLVTAAAALQAGMPATQLAELRRLRGPRSLTAPLDAYLDLLAGGAAPDRAWNHIADLARHEANDAAYRKLTPVDVNRPPPSDERDPTELPDAPGWQLATVSGVGQLDRMRSTALTSLTGRIRQPFGAWSADFDGATIEHAGIGTTGSLGAAARYRTTRGGWAVGLGGVFLSGRDVNEAWTNAGGALVSAERRLGPLSIFAELQGGEAARGSLHTPWITHTAGAAVEVGAFRVSAFWRGNVVPDSVRSSQIIPDTLFPPYDSLNLGGTRSWFPEDTIAVSRLRHRDIHDIAFGAAWGRGPVAFAAQLGRRFGDSARAETWLAGSLSLRVSPIVSLVASAGRTRANLLLGLRGGTTATFGLRWTTGRANADRERADLPELEVTPAIDHAVRLVFVIPGVRREALISGDLTGWNPRKLQRRPDGRWDVTLDAGTPGVHRFNLRVDGGRWEVPPGMKAVDDGFGGRVGLLVLEP